MKKSKKWFVYHICLEGMGLDQGYVGISIDPVRRWKEHQELRYTYPIQKAIKKYGDKVFYRIIAVFDTENEALWQEYTLRPFPRIGWNILRGGTKCPSSNGHSKETMAKIAIANSKRVYKEETRQKQSLIAKARVKPTRTRPVNVFDYKSGKVVSESVLLGVWARENKVSTRLMYETLKADFLKRSSRNNVHQTKGYYARYVS